MRLIYKFGIAFLLLFLMTACQAGSSVPNPYLQSGQPAIKPGTANVTGRLVSVSTGKPFVNEMVALAEVHRNEKGEGAYALNSYSSPQTSTDDNGFFLFKDIPAREYALVTGDPMTRYLVLNDPSTGNVKIWNPQANKILDMGEIRFDYNK